MSTRVHVQVAVKVDENVKVKVKVNDGGSVQPISVLPLPVG
jgi:hypothetical protein